MKDQCCYVIPTRWLAFPDSSLAFAKVLALLVAVVCTLHATASQWGAVCVVVRESVCMLVRAPVA